MAPPKKRKRVKPTPKAESSEEESESSEEEKLQERPKKRRKRGPVSFMEKSKLPRYAGIKTQIQAKRDKKKSIYTRKVHRYGFKLMWRTVPNVLQKNNIKKPGEFDKRNIHGGITWGLPRECNMTNRLARNVMFKCIQSKKLTYDQLRAVRKALAYSHELKGGQSGENWEGVKVAWDTLEQKDLPDKKRNLLPLRIPTPQSLKKAFTTPYNPQSWSLMKFCTGTVAAFDVFVCGLRSGTDICRVKKSSKHTMNTEEGWQTTAFAGGRAKLNKGKYRDWNIWRICLCKGKKHRSPPENQKWELDANHRPTQPLEWEPTCPIAALEFTQSFINAGEKCYPKYLEKSQRMAKGNFNIKNVVALANEWMGEQGAWHEGQPYSNNSGRKSLAKWLSFLSISYRWGFEIHGDLEDVWRKSYQPDLHRSGYKNRNQSRDPDEATRALRMLAKWFDRGCERKIKYSLDVSARLSYHLLKKLGEEKLAERIVQGLPSESEDEEEDGMEESDDEAIIKAMKEEEEEDEMS